jgi:hypothetical protein
VDTGSWFTSQRVDSDLMKSKAGFQRLAEPRTLFIFMLILCAMPLKEAWAYELDSLPPPRADNNTGVYGDLCVGVNAPAIADFFNYAGAALGYRFTERWAIALGGDVSGGTLLGSDISVIRVSGSEVYPFSDVELSFPEWLVLERCHGIRARMG